MNGRLVLLISIGLAVSFGGSFAQPADPAYDQVVALGTVEGDRNRALDLNKEALVLHKKGDLSGAEARWLAAARADPSWWKPVYNLGCIRSLQKRPEQAVALLRLALERGRFLRGYEFLLSPSGTEDNGDLILNLYTDSDFRPIRQSSAFRAFLRTDLAGTDFASLKARAIRCSLTAEGTGGALDHERRLLPEDPPVVYRADYDIQLAAGGTIRGSYQRHGGQHGVKMKSGRWALIDGSLYLLFQHQFTNYPCGDPAQCSPPEPFGEVNVIKNMAEFRARFPECVHPGES